MIALSTAKVTLSNSSSTVQVCASCAMAVPASPSIPATRPAVNVIFMALPFDSPASKRRSALTMARKYSKVKM